ARVLLRLDADIDHHRRLPKLCFADEIVHPHDFFFSSRRRHTRCLSDWSSDVCSSDLSQHGDENEKREYDRRGGNKPVCPSQLNEIGRASCRERVSIWVGEGALKKKKE